MSEFKDKPFDLVELERLIKDKQAELTLMHDGGSVEDAAQLEREIDSLQRSYERMKNFKPLPELDEQIEFMKQAQDPTCCNPASSEMVEAILQTLVGAKKFLQAKEREVKYVDRDERIIVKLQRPYNLHAQMKFLIGLRELIGLEPKKAEHVELLHMYEAINDNLAMCCWVADITAERLLELPSNKPATDELNAANAKRGTHIGSLGVFIEQDLDKSWIAYFEDWCEQPEISGVGHSPEVAIANLFQAREKARQASLFNDDEFSEPGMEPVRKEASNA